MMNMNLGFLPKPIRYSWQRFTVKHLVWDFDGTLYQSNTIGEALEVEYWKLLRKYLPKAKLNDFRELAAQHPSWGALVSHYSSMSEAEVNTYVDAKVEIDAYITPDPNIVETVTNRLAHYTHGILSNSVESRIITGLKKLGFKLTKKEPYGPFKYIIDRNTINKSKPHPDTFAAVRAITQAPSHHHLMIGDSHHHDIEPAEKLGFHALHIQDLSKWVG